VYPRSAKSIALSPQARAALGTDEERSAPTDLIRAILRAPVDLLWNGGIGTLVKASDETDADAADRASDAIRVDARQLRARVVGEGGNLGFTRRARVEYSENGGRINADFIDNSAGVDSSDHEVNLKILLGLAEQRGEITRAQRDELLEAVTEDVVAHVPLQLVPAGADHLPGGRALGRAAVRLRRPDVAAGGGGAAAQPRLRGAPDAEEIADRRRAGRGMVRPELAALVAYAKRWIARSLEASSSSTTRGWSATCAATSRPPCRSLRAPAGRAPAAPPAAVHGELELGRQRARADVRLAGRGRARLRRRPTSCAPTGSRGR
jgi:glutamate dehydrogenase